MSRVAPTLSWCLEILLLVDDAIVVVESVERIIDQGNSPRDAAIQPMGEITGALVGIALVLTAVFLPMAFYGGSSGVIYRQFSLTIVTAMLLSVFIAIVLTPALCATFFGKSLNIDVAAQKGFFGWFNRWVNRANSGYGSWIQKLLAHGWASMVACAVIVVAVGLFFMHTPLAGTRLIA